ncbi:hypothetical protein [Candidatus Poriferisodalis sp.]|uniref:hypothetical protein n=1 Tax=Candidatus Poriferisodalis sp. TaxID=3101277 RepID=UPI003B02977E
MTDVAAEVQQLVQIVVNDAALPLCVRREAATLAGLAGRQPGRACERLEDLRTRVLPDLALHEPERDYARCVSVETFWRHHLRPDRKPYFRADHRPYLGYLLSQPDPAVAIRADLSTATTLIPAEFSWLVPLDHLAGLDGPAIARRLQLRGSMQPFVVFVFPLGRLLQSGVTAREPRGIDTIPAKLLQWTPGGVSGERIDRSIPLVALGGVQWRP